MWLRLTVREPVGVRRGRALSCRVFNQCEAAQLHMTQVNIQHGLILVCHNVLSQTQACFFQKRDAGYRQVCMM